MVVRKKDRIEIVSASGVKENIHLNSIMYEPILDMSDEHLRKVYDDVRALRIPEETADR